MILSTQSFTQHQRYGFEGTVEALKRFGFDGYDFSMFEMAENPDSPLARDGYREKILSLRKTADRAGIVCNQSHAPFPSYAKNNEAWNSTIFGYLVRSLEISALLGASACVIHPCNFWSAKENAEKIYRPLEPYAKKFGVKIALENMWNWDSAKGHAVPCACSTAEDFVKHLNLLDGETFVACLDTGHAEMLGDTVSAVELIRALKDRLQCLHVHDNDKVHDSHTMPYLGNIEWEGIYKALHDTNYRGDLTFEAGMGIWAFPPEVQDEAMKLMCALGRYMISRIEQG